MNIPPPIYFVWRNGAMHPMARFSQLAERSFNSGCTYRMIIDTERSANSHRHYFAAVREAWMNLPEHLQLAFPTETHLRKYALIKSGFCTVKKIVGNRHVAIDSYAIICQEDGVTTVYEAKSQNHKSMGRLQFQASKVAVLDYLAKLIETTPDELVKAGKAA